MKKVENVCVCGIGGVGGYFAGKMAYKIAQDFKDKYKIYFIARGPHLKEIKKNGLELHTNEGEKLICKPTLATNNLDEISTPDLCLICVKSYDLDNIVKALKEKVSEKTVIIPLMNGIDIYDRIRKILKKGIVLPSCVYIGSHIEKPGLVIQSGNPGFANCGFDPKYPDYKPQYVFDFFEEMQLLFNWKDDPYPAIWEKYLLVASFALVTAYKDQIFGEVFADDESLDLIRKIMAEIIEIAKPLDIKLPKDVIEKIIEFCKDYPDIKTSYQRDVEKKRKNEGDLFGGTIIRLGKKFGIPTPITQKIYDAIEKRIHTI